MGRRPMASLPGGSEATSLLTLGGLLIVVLAVILASRREPAPPPPTPLTLAQLPPLPPAEDSKEFQGLQDKTVLGLRDTAAFKLLVERVREVPPELLHQQARRELAFSQFFDDPGRYRGLPIHLQGRALRILVQNAGQNSAIFPNGRFFESYVVTPDSQRNPYVLVSEDLPQDMPIGDAIDVPIRFDGYFLKLMAYESGDGKLRAAPLLIGRFANLATIEGLESSEPRPHVEPGQRWPLYLGLTLALLLLCRIGLGLLRAFGFFGRRRLIPRPSVTDQIEPEALAAWINDAERSEPEDEKGPGE